MLTALAVILLLGVAVLSIQMHARSRYGRSPPDDDWDAESRDDR